MADVTVTIRTLDDQTVPVPLENVLVRIFRDGAFVASGYTDASGEVDFTLAATVVGVDYEALLHKEGVSFLPSPSKDFTALELGVNVFEYTGHVGLQGAVVKFVVKDESDNLVEDVRIRIFESPADTFLTELETDASGEAEIVLQGAASPGKEYIVRDNPPSGYSSQGTRTIAVLDPLGVGETNIFDLTVSAPPDVPVCPDPDMCRLSGYFSDPSLRPLKNLTLTFHPREGYPSKVIAGAPFSGEPTVVRNRIVASERRVSTDKNGYIELDLPRDSIFDVYAQGLDAGDHTLLAAIYVPDIAGIEVHEVLFPYVTKVTYGSVAISLAVGESVELSVAIEASNYQPIAGKASLSALLTFSSSDPAKMSVDMTSEGKLLITGLAAGSAQVQVERVVGTYAPRRPEVSSLTILPSVPTVTVT